ncbi:MAG: DUF2892 domain-containing protein [Proteobacteria bacterium]|nr:MAG: DUF2892 domain-containing protein [Pseudomonadota bacterium]
MKRNVAGMERIASLLLGGLSLSQTLKAERSVPLKAVAGAAGLALLWRGASGNCPLYSGLDFSTHNADNDQTILPVMLDRSALINKTPDEVRRFLEVNDSPFGRFETGTVDDEFLLTLDQRLWTLKLSPHADGKRTLIKVSWKDLGHGASSAEPSAVKHGLLAKINIETSVPERMLELRKLKSLIETGEIASIEGQAHGERSRFGTFIENFGDRILQKVQSKTPLPTDEKQEQNVPDNNETTHKRRAHA